MYINVDAVHEATRSYKRGDGLKGILGVKKRTKKKTSTQDPGKRVVLNAANREVIFIGKNLTAIKIYLMKHGTKDVTCTPNFSLVVSHGTYKKTRGTASKHARSTFSGGYKKAFGAAWGPPPGLSHGMEAVVATQRHYVRVHAAQTQHVGKPFEHNSKPTVDYRNDEYAGKRLTFLQICGKIK